MNDSTRQPVSVELERDDWVTVIGILRDGGTVSRRLGEKLAAELPQEFPEGLGAVILARRTTDPHGAPVFPLVRTNLSNREPGYLHWRMADADGQYWDEASLRVVEVLSPGVKL